MHVEAVGVIFQKIQANLTIVTSFETKDQISGHQLNRHI
jgi:hypothetical protein